MSPQPNPTYPGPADDPRIAPVPIPCGNCGSLDTEPAPGTRPDGGRMFKCLRCGSPVVHGGKQPAAPPSPLYVHCERCGARVCAVEQAGCAEDYDKHRRAHAERCPGR